MSNWEDVADALRAAVFEHFEQRGRPLAGRSGLNTLETNSGYVARRALPIVELLRRRGVPSLKGTRIIDLGCGFGTLALFFASLGATVTAIDVGEQRLRVGNSLAERFGLQVTFHVRDLRDRSIETGAYDIAVQNNSLCYVIGEADRRMALASALDSLRPGGIFVLRDPNRSHPLDAFTKIPLLTALEPATAVSVARRLGRDRSLVQLRSSGGAVRELRAAGFVDVDAATVARRLLPTTALARYYHVVACRPHDE